MSDLTAISDGTTGIDRVWDLIEIPRPWLRSVPSVTAESPSFTGLVCQGTEVISKYGCTGNASGTQPDAMRNVAEWMNRRAAFV